MLSVYKKIEKSGAKHIMPCAALFYTQLFFRRNFTPVYCGSATKSKLLTLLLSVTIRVGSATVYRFVVTVTV